jgi:hypothetical protein
MAKNTATQNSGQHAPAHREATFTVLTTHQGNLTKECSLDANNVIKKKSSPNFSGGTYEVRSALTLATFKKIRLALNPNQALMFSTPIIDSERGLITTKKLRHKAALSRTNDCFAHPVGPAILAIDYDPRPDAKPLAPNELIARLHQAVPGLKNTQMLWAASAGSCISNSKTNHEYVGIAGQRIYLIVADGCDINRALRVIARRLWLVGEGWIKISKAGRKLKRTLVDLALANPVQPDFAAGAVCDAPLVQHRKQKLIGQGDYLDSLVEIPSLTPAEELHLAKVYALAETAAEPEARAAREQWLAEYGNKAVSRATTAGIMLTAEEQQQIREEAVAALDNGILGGDFQIVLENGIEVSVAEILKNPARYHGALCHDPLEPDYDDSRVVGKIFTTRTPIIHSYAHGGQTFTLMRQQTAVEWLNTDSAISVQATLEVMRNTGSFFDFGKATERSRSTLFHVIERSSPRRQAVSSAS